MINTFSPCHILLLADILNEAHMHTHTRKKKQTVAGAGGQAGRRAGGQAGRRAGGQAGGQVRGLRKPPPIGTLCSLSTYPFYTVSVYRRFYYIS